MNDDCILGFLKIANFEENVWFCFWNFKSEKNSVLKYSRINDSLKEVPEILKKFFEKNSENLDKKKKRIFNWILKYVFLKMLFLEIVISLNML